MRPGDSVVTRVTVKEIKPTPKSRGEVICLTTSRVGDVTVIDGEHERGWFIRFTKEPDWKLPPAVGYLIKTPLRRPFKDAGAMFRLALLDAPGRQSIIGRRTSATVQESAILRFLNRLSGTAMGDFVGKAETEENRFSAEVFNAMRLDARALIQ